MIGKIISSPAHSEEAAVLKKDEGNGGALPVFKSLLDVLQKGNIAAGKEKSMEEGMLSDEEKESPADEVKHSKAAKAGTIFGILSEGDPKNEEEITRLRQLLNQLQQEGRGASEQSPQAGGESEPAAALKHPGGDGEAAGGSKEKMRSAELGADLRELLSQHMTDEEAGRLARAAASGQTDSAGDKIARVLSEGNLKEEEVITQLRKLLGQLQQKEPGQAAAAFESPASAPESEDGSEKARSVGAAADLRELLSQHLPDEEAGRLARAAVSGQTDSAGDRIARVLSEGNLKEEEIKTRLRQLLKQVEQEGQKPEVHSPKAGGESEPAQAEGKNTVEPEAHARTEAPKTDRLFPGGSDDSERGVRENSRASLSGKEPENGSSRDRLKKSAAVNTGRHSEHPAATGRSGRLGIPDQQKEITGDFLLKNPPGGTAEKGLGMKSAQLLKSLQKEDRNPPGGGAGRSGGTGGERRTLFGGFSSSADGNRNNIIAAGSSGTGPSTDSMEASAGGQEIMWKEHSAESVDTKEDRETGPPVSASSSLKLGQVPIANAELRTRVLPALTRNALAAASEARKTPEQWQKHNFVLDDGKKMQLSVREVRGVLQVKMGSMNLDLSKLLQQHLQQIREHLKQEFGSGIDLQLDHPDQEGPASHFSGRSPGGNGRDESPLRSGGVEPGAGDTGKAKLKAVRNFGYNEMEWIA